MKSSAFRWLLPLTALACVGRDETGLTLNYDTGTLAPFRSAIPTEQRLIAAVPRAGSGDSPAVLAGQGVVFARGINQPARDIARTLQTIAGDVPTGFDAERQEFVWGPWQSPSGPGEVTLHIRRNAGRNFEYSYALALEMPGEPESHTPVVWGGANPEADERGTGLVVWDLDAHATFEAEHGGSADGTVGQGRAVMAYGHVLRDPDSVFFNQAVFRDFVAPVNPGMTAAAPVSVEHFFGRVAEPSGSVLDFLRTEIDANLCEESPASCFGASLDGSTPERFVFGEFLVDSGVGRAEVALSGGDLSSEIQMTECWNSSLTRTSYQVRTDDQTMQMMPGAECPGRAAQSAEELGLPTPDDVQPWLLYALSCAVEPGAVGCD